MNRLIILFSFLVFFIATEVNAENKKLSARAEANDANGDGLIQKNEAVTNQLISIRLRVVGLVV